MTDTTANKAFIQSMLGQKLSLEDFPGRFDPDLLMHEPVPLPFGGTHRGFDAFKRFYPEVRAFYDFERFELLGVYDDGDMVFATFHVGIAGSPNVMFIAEQFRFADEVLVEVRVHTCEATVADLSS